MQPRDMVLLTLREWNGRIGGKTKLQKIVYFTALLSGQEDGLGYDAHYYGPYSPVVEEALYELTAIGLVDVRTLRTGQVDGLGFEKVRYDYSLTEGGLQVAESRSVRLGADGKRVIRAARKVRKQGEQHYMRLAAAAKLLHLVRRSGRPVTQVELQEMAPHLGWHLSDEEADRAVEYLAALGLVKVSAAPTGRA